MYTMEQAEQIAADCVRQLTADWDVETAMFPEGKYKAQKGEFFYFAFQSAKYVATREEKYFCYGPCQVSVHGVTGECRLLDVHESIAIDPFGERG
ncbi:hypothetical protein E2C11_06130 [Streptomyces lavendulae]|nr:hypothetical protein [Streptomyces lavendulae]TXJ85450.1 hypothetical protein E2C11_06130 [Streptomyces lavendulae]